MSAIENSTSLLTSMKEDSFWKAVDILIEKPHVINKRLWGSKILFKMLCEYPEVLKIPDSYKRLEKMQSHEDFKEQLIKDLCLTQFYETNGKSLPLHEIILLELLPKTYTECHAYQLVILTKYKLSVTFWDVSCQDDIQTLCPTFSYTISLENQAVKLSSKCSEIKSYQWLKTKVMPQFIKWGEESINQNICNESLALVCKNKYYQKYNDLKLKYGKEMVKIWPECTDPSKFVYEDVAIATYLLLLWEDERSPLNLENKQTFVDLGCGNGLLVYILSKEGHKGIGFDVRKRQIWDLYENDVNLEEATITPSDEHLFPEADWIIGNHSDELTPWIPVIAARSSFNCNFFLLPCCAYNFNGSKYQRQNSGQSQYTEYLHYLKQLCKDIGFRTDTDRLKIPSTKRICLVGRGRNYTMEEHEIYCNKIQYIINNNTNLTETGNTNLWVNDFKPRDTKEKVRNCTQIDKDLIDKIVEKISKHLLLGSDLNSNWSIGKTAELGEVVGLISQDELKSLKSECGGLQTLLKNNHHIFKVQGGKVQLRYPKTVEEVNNKFNKNINIKESKINLQQRPCWFFNYHPQGCPMDDKNCSFLHIKMSNYLKK